MLFSWQVKYRNRFAVMSSKEHFETMQMYKELDRQDKAAASAGVQPTYQQTGVYEKGWQPASSSSGPSSSNAAGKTSTNK